MPPSSEDMFPHRRPRKWLRLTLVVPAGASEAACALLAEMTGGGLEIAAGGRTGATGKIVGYVEKTSSGAGETAARLAELRLRLATLARDFPGSAPELAVDEIEEQDWGTAWKKGFVPFAVSSRLVIKPSWESYASRGKERVLELDPGLAFGTGHHASTRLALQLLDDLYQGGRPPADPVLDVGTGTGILAMACALFGAVDVTAVDNDPDALAAAAENTARNGLQSAVRVSRKAVQELTGPYGLITANITSDILIAMAGDLTRLLAGSGRLVLAGILAGEQAEAVGERYGESGLKPAGRRVMDEWVALLFEKG